MLGGVTVTAQGPAPCRRAAASGGAGGEVSEARRRSGRAPIATRRRGSPTTTLPGPAPRRHAFALVAIAGLTVWKVVRGARGGHDASGDRTVALCAGPRRLRRQHPRPEVTPAGDVPRRRCALRRRDRHRGARLNSGRSSDRMAARQPAPPPSAGSTKRNAAPPSREAATSSSPSCRRAIMRAIGRPSPTPPASAPVEPHEALEDACAIAGAMPGPESSTITGRCRSRPRRRGGSTRRRRVMPRALLEEVRDRALESGGRRARRPTRRTRDGLLQALGVGRVELDGAAEKSSPSSSGSRDEPETAVLAARREAAAARSAAASLGGVAHGHERVVLARRRRASS